MEEVYDELERLIVNKYIRNKTFGLNTFIKRGVLFSGSDWLSEDPPIDLDPSVIEILLYMVFIHEELIHTIDEKTTKGGILLR